MQAACCCSDDGREATDLALLWPDPVAARPRRAPSEGDRGAASQAGCGPARASAELPLGRDALAAGRRRRARCRGWMATAGQIWTGASPRRATTRQLFSMAMAWCHGRAGLCEACRDAMGARQGYLAQGRAGGTEVVVRGVVGSPILGRGVAEAETDEGGGWTLEEACEVRRLRAAWSRRSARGVQGQQRGGRGAELHGPRRGGHTAEAQK